MGPIAVWVLVFWYMSADTVCIYYHVSYKSVSSLKDLILLQHKEHGNRPQTCKEKWTSVLIWKIQCTYVKICSFLVLEVGNKKRKLFKACFESIIFGRISWLWFWKPSPRWASTVLTDVYSWPKRQKKPVRTLLNFIYVHEMQLAQNWGRKFPKLLWRI